MKGVVDIMLVRFSISALCVVEGLREWRHGRGEWQGERRLNDQIDSPWTQTFINRNLFDRCTQSYRPWKGLHGCFRLQMPFCRGSTSVTFGSTDYLVRFCFTSDCPYYR